MKKPTVKEPGPLRSPPIPGEPRQDVPNIPIEPQDGEDVPIDEPPDERQRRNDKRKRQENNEI